MSMIKDRFRALPIKERAALINKYVSDGVMDLEEMKRHYNSFDTDGDTNNISKEEYNSNVRILDGKTEENQSLSNEEKKKTNTDKKRIEDVVRTTRGATGELLNVSQWPYLYDAWRVMHGSDKHIAPKNANYTGAAMVGRGMATDGGIGFVSQQELEDVLGYAPKDFVDTFIYGEHPFKELGVIKKDVSPEKHVLRTKVKKVEKEGKQLNTYQTHKDTLNAEHVAYLDKMLNSGLIDIDNENLTTEKSPFVIGNSGIYYDGNNATIVTGYLPNGQPVSKAIDVFDTDPTEWNYKVGERAKTGLGYIHNNSTPFIMTTPWYFPVKANDYEGRLKHLFGIDVDNYYNVLENKGDKNGVIWELGEAIEWLYNHDDLTETPIKATPQKIK